MLGWRGFPPAPAPLGIKEQFAAAEHITAGWRREDYERAASKGRQLLTRMSEARAHGVAPEDDEALDLVAEHHREVTVLWPANAAAYSALGDLLVEDPNQRATIAHVDPHLPLILAALSHAGGSHQHSDYQRPDGTYTISEAGALLPWPETPGPEQDRLPLDPSPRASERRALAPTRQSSPAARIGR